MSRQIIQSFSHIMALSTLAAKVALIGGTIIDGSREQGVRIKDMWLHVGWKGKTVDEGPIVYGIGKDLTSVALLKAYLEADPQGIDDVAELQKLAAMKVMVLGNINFASTDSKEQFEGMRKIKFPWKDIDEGSDLQVWAFNRDSGALTTGTSLDFEFVINGEWLHD